MLQSQTLYPKRREYPPRRYLNLRAWEGLQQALAILIILPNYPILALTIRGPWHQPQDLRPMATAIRQQPDATAKASIYLSYEALTLSPKDHGPKGQYLAPKSIILSPTTYDPRLKYQRLLPPITWILTTQEPCYDRPGLSKLACNYSVPTVLRLLC